MLDRFLEVDKLGEQRRYTFGHWARKARQSFVWCFRKRAFLAQWPKSASGIFAAAFEIAWRIRWAIFAALNFILPDLLKSFVIEVILYFLR